MLSDWELWAVANKLIEQRGDQAPAFAATRIEELARAGDRDGVAAWEAISTRVGQLSAPPPPRLDS